MGAFGAYGLVPSKWRTDPDPGTTSICVAFGAAISLVALGTIGIYLNWWIGVWQSAHAILGGVYVALGCYGLIQFRKDFRSRDRAARQRLVRRALLLCAVLAPALLVMAPAVTTPYFYGDDDAYHVSLIRYWFQEHQLDRVSFHSYFAFPLLSSEIAALFVPLVGLQAAKLVQLGFVAIGAVGVYGIVLFTTGRLALALVFAFLYETLPVHFMWAFAAMADRSTACLMTLGTGALLLVPAIGASAAVLLSAILLSGATAMKQQGAFALLGLLPLVWIATQRASPRLTQALGVAAGAATICLVILLPWYGRAYLTTGSATFPMHPAAGDTLLRPAQKELWAGTVLEPDLARMTTLVEQLYAYSSDRFNDVTNPSLAILFPVMIAAALHHRQRIPRGTGLLVIIVATYLILLAIVSLFFAPGVRTNSSSVWSAGRYRTFLYPDHGSLLLLGAMSCAAVGLSRRGTAALAVASAFMLLAQTVDLSAYLRWSVPSFLGFQSADAYLVGFHSLGPDLVIARQLLSDGDRVALDRYRTQINVPGHITPTTRLLGPVYSTAKTIDAPERCERPSDLEGWLVEHHFDAIVTSKDACADVDRWARDPNLEVTVGQTLIIARIPRR